MATFRILQLFVFFTVLSLGMSQINETMGDCNMTYVNQELYKCQHVAMEDLHFKKDCSSVWDDQEECTNKVAEKCVQNSMTHFHVFYEVKRLFRVLQFGCFKRSLPVADKLLNVLKCNASNTDAKAMFNRIPDCWTDLAIKVKANPLDPALCGVLKKAKQCVSDELKTHCFSLYTEQDSCNAFCENGTDDSRPCPGLPITFDESCNNVTQMYKKFKGCRTNLVTILYESPEARPCSVELEKNEKGCADYHLDECYKPLRDPIEFNQLKKLFRSVMWGKRFFCEATPYDVTGLSVKLKKFLPGCTNAFFTEADKCGAKLRQAFADNKNDKPTLCKLFVEAKECYYTVLGKQCSFTDEDKAIIGKDGWNPFCANNVDSSNTTSTTKTTGAPTPKAGSEGRKILWIVTLFSSFLPIVLSALL